MEQNQIRIEKIRLKELHDFARRIFTDPSFDDVAPISLVRADAQMRNPYGAPEDVALLVAYEKNRCVGYFGLMPGLLLRNGMYSKIFWATTFFVSPECRGRGLGSRILNEARGLKIDFVLSGMTESARRAYDRAGFRSLGRLTYFQIQVGKIRFLGSFFAALSGPPGKNSYRSQKLISRLARWEISIYQGSKKVFYRLAWGPQKNSTAPFRYRSVSQIRDDVLKSAPVQSAQSVFYRGIEAVNWMLKHPWILSGSQGNRDVPNYFFTSVRDLFRYVALEIHSADGTSLKGFLVLSIFRKRANTIVKLLDFHFQSPDDNPIAAYLGLKYAHRYFADIIEFPESLRDCFSYNPFLRPLIKRRKRRYLYQPESEESPLAVSANNVDLSYCDADTAFT